MNLTGIFLLGMCLHLSASVNSQVVTIKKNNSDIQQVFEELRQQTGHFFIINDRALRHAGPVTLELENTPLITALDKLFENQPLSYTIHDKVIVVKLAQSRKRPPKPVEEQGMLQLSVRGKVTDTAGMGLPGVSVQVKGTGIGTATDDQGLYELLNVDENAVLEFTYLGFIPLEMPVSGRTVVNATLQSDISMLDELVVVGYGVQTKASLTGAVAVTKGEEIRQSPATNLTNSLVGRLPGLVALNQSGEPGNDASTIRIRGMNTLGDNNALIVVDGIPNRDFSRINPADIESITVMKDAMAAIYGAQAANGVILVTTKRGKQGKPRLSFDLNFGYNQPTRIPEMADAAQYASMLNEIAFYNNPAGGRNQKFTEEDLRLFQDGSDPWGHPNTDWFDEVFKDYSPQSYHNVSLSGGSEHIKYFISLGAKNQDGYYKNSATRFGQVNFRSNLDAQISSNLSVSLDISGRQEEYNYPTRSATSIFRSLMRGKPNRPAYWPDGSPGPELEFGDQPAVTSTDATGYDKTRWYRLETNLSMKFNVPWVDGLSVQANASIDKGLRSQKRFETPWYLYTWDGNPEHQLAAGRKGLESPQLTQASSDLQNITLNAYATYEPLLGNQHALKVMLGTESREGINSSFSAFRKNYISGEIDELFAGASDEFMSNNGSSSQNARLNYFGRINYDFSQKYLLEFVWRYDGSYMFPKNKQFGFFPGVSLGWRMSEEPFWKNSIGGIDNFKLRGSWGQTGNDRISEYQYLSSYGFMNQVYVFGVDQDAKLLNELRIPNPNITWEVANQANIGFEMLFLNNRLAVEADLFSNVRSNILYWRNASIPGSSGMSLPMENIGKVGNRGLEGTISFRDKAGDLDYSVSVNASYSRNRIIFWDETPGVPDYQRSTGRPMGSELYYKAIGVFEDDAALAAYPHWGDARPGDVIFEDVNKDGVIDGLDRVRIEKSNMPTFIGGLNFSLRFRQFDLSALIQGAAGAQLYVHPESGELGNYYREFAENRWTPENPSSTTPRAFDGNNEYWRSQRNTYWLRSTDYARLKNIEIGYSFSENTFKLVGIEAFRIYVNGLNLFTVDKAKVIDPESVGDGLGIPYPIARVVNAGLSLTF